ncbi:EpsG family protein [Clostridium sp.]|uniref:EpsG family protein n=1 Tax=Clostridium sp. TaxID=1506 RepID=UPI003F67DED7
MLLYIGTILLCVLDEKIILAKNLNILLKKMYIICLVFVIGFRYKIGTDYDTYVRIINENLWIEDIGQERIYVEIYKILDKYSMDSQMFFLITTVIMIYFLNKFIKYTSPYYYLSFFLFFVDQKFFMNVWSNGVRQAIAISIFLYSLKFIVYKNQKIIGIGYIALGSLFHISILSTIPIVLFLDKIKIKKKYWLFIPCVTIVIKKLTNYIILLLGGRYLGYLHLDFKPNGIKIVIIFLILSFLLVIFYNRVLNYLYFEKIINKNEKIISDRLIKLFQIGVFMYVGLTPISTNLARLSDYYIILIIVIIPLYKKYSELSKEKKYINKSRIYIAIYIFIAMIYQAKNITYYKNSTSVNNFDYKLNIKILKNEEEK